ncbi:hypothetical protein F2Q68_00024560 [Brassica cretica]|uniref:Uncharacterized protein n=1 Tax=Brassica cretica TaxID=69181 RepID=A0A8S9IBH8_BRACR|nr:hypothetical protein F2Q68_00024560 [Brassica cretica]
MIPSKPVIFSYNQVEVPSEVSSDPRVQISRSSAQYSAGNQVYVQVEISPVKTFILGFGHVLSDQPAASRLEHCRSPSCEVGTTGPMPYMPDYYGFKETPYLLDREDSDRRGHGLWLNFTRRCNVAVTRKTVGCRAVTWRTVGRSRLKVPSSGLCGSDIKSEVWFRFPLLEARSWQEAKSNLETVALGKDDRIAWCWTLGVMSPILDRIVRTDCGAWKCTSMVIWPKDKRVIAWK